jgi:hypothetical protein
MLKLPHRGLDQMKEKTGNPKRNLIPEGIQESVLIRGIEKSGYPLQSVVADRLAKSGFHVTEEWGYSDRESGSTRPLDVLAVSNLRLDQRATVVPGLVLMIECKKSEHPFIFFRMVTQPYMFWFPSVFGLPHSGVSLRQRKNSSSDPERHEIILASRALGLGELPFSDGPDRAASFSQAIPHGKDRVDLSGAEAFNSLVLPLSKAADHAWSVYGHGHVPGYSAVFARAALSVAVLDAPMILVEDPERVAEPIYTPWVRIVRQEPNLRPGGANPFKHYAIDAVHIDFFDEYLEKHLSPFAQEFARRSEKFGEIFLDGGEVPNLDSWTWNKIQRWSGAPARPPL